MSNKIPHSLILESSLVRQDKPRREKDPIKGQHTVGASELEDPFFVSSGKEYESNYSPTPLTYISHDNPLYDISSEYLKKITGYEKFLYPIREEFGDLLADFTLLTHRYIADHKQDQKKNFFTKETSLAAQSGSLSIDSIELKKAIKDINDIFNNKFPIDASGINPKNIYTNLHYIALVKNLIFPLISAVVPSKMPAVQEVISKLGLDKDSYVTSDNKDKVFAFNAAFEAVGKNLVSFFSSLKDETANTPYKSDLTDILNFFSDAVIKADSTGVYDDSPEGLAALSKIVSPSIVKNGKVTPSVVKNTYYALVSAFAGATALPYLQVDKSSPTLRLTSDAKNKLHSLQSAVLRTSIANKGDFFPAFGGTKTDYFWANYRKAKEVFNRELESKLGKEDPEVTVSGEAPAVSEDPKLPKIVGEIYSSSMISAGNEYSQQFSEDFSGIDELINVYFSSKDEKEAEEAKADAIKKIESLEKLFTAEIEKGRSKVTKVIGANPEFTFTLTDETLRAISEGLAKYNDSEYEEAFLQEFYELIQVDKVLAKKALYSILAPEVETISAAILPHLEDTKALLNNLPRPVLLGLDSRISEIVALDSEISELISSDNSTAKATIEGKMAKLDSLFASLKTDANSAVSDPAAKATLVDMVARIVQLYGYDNVLDRVSSNLASTEIGFPESIHGFDQHQLMALIIRWIPKEKDGSTKKVESFKSMPLTVEDLKQLGNFIISKDRNRLGQYQKELKFKPSPSPLDKKRAEALTTVANWVSPVATGSMKKMTQAGHEVRHGYDVYRKGTIQTSGQAFHRTRDALDAFLGHEAKNPNGIAIAPEDPMELLFSHLTSAIKNISPETLQVLESGDAEAISAISNKDLLDTFTGYHGSKESVLDILATYFTFTEKGNDPENVKGYYDALRSHQDALSVGNTKTKSPSLENTEFGKIVAKTIKQMAVNKTLFQNPTLEGSAPFNADANVVDQNGKLLPPFASKLINLLLSLEPREVVAKKQHAAATFFPMDGNLKEVGLAATTSQRSGLLNRILDADIYPQEIQANPLLVLEFQYKLLKTIVYGINKFVMPELAAHKETLAALMTSKTLDMAKEGDTPLFSKETRDDIVKTYDKLTDALNSSMMAIVGDGKSYLDSLLKTISIYCMSKHIAPYATMGLAELEDHILTRDVHSLEYEVLKKVPIFAKIQALQTLLTTKDPSTDDQVIGLFKCLSNLVTTSLSYLVNKRALLSIITSSTDEATKKLAENASRSLDMEHEDILHVIYGGPSNPDKFKEALDNDEELERIKAFSYSHLKSFMTFIVDDLKKSTLDRKSVERAKQQDAIDKENETKKDSFYEKVEFSIEFSTLELDRETKSVEIARAAIPGDYFKEHTKGREVKESLTTKGKKAVKAKLTTEQQALLVKYTGELKNAREKFIPNKKLNTSLAELTGKWETFADKFKLNHAAKMLDFFPGNNLIATQEEFERVFDSNRKTKVTSTVRDGVSTTLEIPVPNKDAFYNEFIDTVLGTAGRREQFFDLVTCKAASLGGAKHFIFAVQGRTGKTKVQGNSVLSHGERTKLSVKGQPNNTTEITGTPWMSSEVAGGSFDTSALDDFNVTGGDIIQTGLLITAETLSEQYATQIANEYPPSHEYYDNLVPYITAIQALPKYFNFLHHCNDVAVNHPYDINAYTALKAKAAPLYTTGHLQMLPIAEALKYIKNYKTQSLPKEGLSEGVEEDSQEPDSGQPAALAALPTVLSSGSKVEASQVVAALSKTNKLDVLDMILKSSLTPQLGLIDAIDACTSKDYAGREEAIVNYVSTKNPGEQELIKLMPSAPGGVLRAMFAANKPLTPGVLTAASKFRAITAPVLTANKVPIPADWPAAEAGMADTSATKGGASAWHSDDPIDQAKFHIMKEAKQLPELWKTLYGTNSLSGVQIHFIKEDGTEFIPEGLDTEMISIINNSYQVLDAIASEMI